MDNSAPQPLHDVPFLKTFQQIIMDGPPERETFQHLLEALEAEQHLEHALTLLKQARPDLGVWGEGLAALKAAVARSRVRRMSLWQADPRRRTLRLRLEVRTPACEQHPPALLASLARLLMEAGLPLAMGLEKNPRPAVHLGHPLPLGVEGWCEWADAVLQEGPTVALEALPDHLNGHAPAGLRLLQCTLVPNHASPVSELCRQGRWRWPCPAPLGEVARERVAAFVTATTFEVEKPGKVEGHKGAKRVDLRPLLAEAQWEGEALCFRTRIGPGEAGNPRKLLAPILGLEPEAIQGLVRTEVVLREDPRLLREDRFAPKLHNMFEDAVLLESGSNIRIIDDDDDDEPVILG
jgi:radical SAM-linked protein